MLHNTPHKFKTVFDKPIIVVGGITLFGALLRLYHLGFKTFWLDEAAMYWISNSGNIKNILSQNALVNSAPPLFALLTKLTLKIGDSEAILRLLPWFSGVAAIPAIYFLTRLFLEKTPAYLVTFIVAISMTQVRYSQQLREYSLTVLLATIILALFFRQLRSPSWSNLVLMTLAMALGVFLQYGLALLIIALNLIFAIELLSPKDNRKFLLLMWSASQFVVLGAVIVVYYFSLKQQMVVGFGTGPSSGYLSDAYWNGSFKSIFNLATSNTRDIFEFAYPGVIFFFITVIGFITILKTKRNHTALMMFIFPVILTFLAALAKLYPYQGSRQVIFLTPMIYVLFGFGINHLLNMTQQRWVVLLLLLFTFVTGLTSTIDFLNGRGTEHMRPVAAALSELYEEGDLIYVYYYAKPAFTYYYRDNLYSQIYGTMNRENPERYFQEIDNFISSDNRIWFVFSHCYADECEIIPEYVSEQRNIELVVSANNAFLYLAP